MDINCLRQNSSTGICQAYIFEERFCYFMDYNRAIAVDCKFFDMIDENLHGESNEEDSI